MDAKKMKNVFLTTAALVGLAVPAHAETYACEIMVGLIPETHLVKVDVDKHTFQWRGKSYRISQQRVNPEPECQRDGWHVTGNGTSFAFCLGTKGGGFFLGQPKNVADNENSVVTCSSFVKD
jgi:hypothetical protein